jgi:hypothetical protein
VNSLRQRQQRRTTDNLKNILVEIEISKIHYINLLLFKMALGDEIVAAGEPEEQVRQIFECSII